MAESIPPPAPEVLQALSTLQEQDLAELLDDSIKHLRGMQVPFLSKYRERLGSSLWIAPTREYIIDLCQYTLRHTHAHDPLDTFKQLSLPESLTPLIFGRRQELAKILTNIVFTQSTDSVLLDYNYNIETVLASDSFGKVNEPLLTLELILKQGDNSLRRVYLEFNVEEARDFVERLRSIEKEVLQASQ